MVNINKLKGKIVENGMNVELLAKKMNIDKTTLYRKLNDEGKNLTIREVNLMVKELKLSAEEIGAIFFNQVVA